MTPADAALDALLAQAATGDQQAAAQFHAARNARQTVAAQLTAGGRNHARRMLAADLEDTL